MPFTIKKLHLGILLIFIDVIIKLLCFFYEVPWVVRNSLTILICFILYIIIIVWILSRIKTNLSFHSYIYKVIFVISSLIYLGFATLLFHLSIVLFDIRFIREEQPDKNEGIVRFIPPIYHADATVVLILPEGERLSHENIIPRGCPSKPSQNLNWGFSSGWPEKGGKISLYDFEYPQCFQIEFKNLKFPAEELKIKVYPNRKHIRVIWIEELKKYYLVFLSIGGRLWFLSIVFLFCAWDYYYKQLKPQSRIIIPER